MVLRGGVYVSYRHTDVWYSTSNKSKTIFEVVCGFNSDVETVTVDCFAYSLEENETSTDKELLVRNPTYTRL